MTIDDLLITDYLLLHTRHPLLVTRYQNFLKMKKILIIKNDSKTITKSSEEADLSCFEKDFKLAIIADQTIDETLLAKGFAEIKKQFFSEQRKASVARKTSETDITVELNLDGSGVSNISTSIGFFDHLLEQISKHGGLDLTVNVKGDLHIDEHHTIEDVAIVLGEAFLKALGRKKGIERYGFLLPMDDCLAQVAIDFGGRPWLVWDAEFKREKIGELPTEMIMHFFKSFSDNAKCNLNIKAEGKNEHHKAEAIFKAFAKAIKMAVKRATGLSVPSTKGIL